MTDEIDIKLNEHYAGKVVRKDLMTKFSLEVYTDPIDAAFKAIGVK